MGGSNASALRRRAPAIAAAVLLAVVAFLLWSAAGGGGASGATIHRLNLAAPSFMGHDSSIHNDGDNTFPDACAAPVPLAIGDDNRGDLQNGKGSFIANADLPNGATVTKLTLFANDNDTDFDSTAYLVRKRITGGLSPAKSGYVVMAQASTNGAVNDTLRAFSDTSVQNAVVDTSKYQYSVELVNCATTVEPFSVQIVSSG